jgi:hypothetical protein
LEKVRINEDQFKKEEVQEVFRESGFEAIVGYWDDF